MKPQQIDTGARQVTFVVEVDRSPSDVFALVANPHRHRELDGSGTVRSAVAGPSCLAEGDIFTINMHMLGLPYRIRSRVTAVETDRLIEWRHPLGHHWRWRLDPTPTGTKITETFDYSRASGLWASTLRMLGFVRANTAGIRTTLEKLAQ